jgi:hypothetical protein
MDHPFAGLIKISSMPTQQALEKEIFLDSLRRFLPLSSKMRNNSMRQAHQKSAGPEVLTWEEVEWGKPGINEARIRHIVV